MKPPKGDSPWKLFLLAVLALLSFCASSFGLGIELPDQDAFATARGNAFTATADDPAAVYYNPAGISQLKGINVSMGAYGLVYGDQYKGGPLTLDTRTEWTAIPQLFATFELPKMPVTFGIGAYAPYGLVEEWPATSPFAGEAKRGEIDYYTLNPVVAYQPISTLSIAVGPTFNYSEVDLRQENPSFIPFESHFHGEDEALGFNAGIMWKPLPEHSFGLSYRSSTQMNYNGHAVVPFPAAPFPAVTFPAKAAFQFPNVVDFGYSFRPTPNWNLEADGEWLSWETLNTVTVHGTGSANPPFGAIPGAALNEGIPFNWNSSWIAKIGGTRYFGDGWRVSAGYMFVENSVPSEYFNPLVPDSDRHVFSVGIGKRYHNLSWDAAYQLAWGPSRSVTGDVNPAADGNYEFLSHAITINVGYHF